MSNRLTFSLTSLILIFALAFVAMPAMADHGGPTVTITPYTGKNLATPAVDHVQTRSDFRVKVEFSHLITGFDTTDVTLQTAESRTSLLSPVTGGTPVTILSAASPGSGAGGVPATELTANKVYVLILDLQDADYAAGYMAVSIAKDMVTGAEAAVNGIGNETGSYDTDSLPKANAWTLTPVLDEDSVKQLADGETGDDFDDAGKILTSASFTVEFTASGGPAGEIYPVIPANQIQIKDSNGMNVSATATPAGSYVADKLEVTIASFSAVTDAPIFVGVNPNWAGTAGAAVRIPKAEPEPTPDPTVVHPTVDISLVGVDETAETFEVKFTFAQATAGTGETAGPLPSALMPANIAVTKGDPPMASSAYVQDADIIGPISGGTVWLVTVNYRLDALPLNVGLTGIDVSATTISGTAPGATDPSTLMVGTPAPTMTVPATPAAPTATADQTAKTITISWTAPDDGGSPITGYTVTKHYMMNGTAATKDFSATASPLTIPPAGSTDTLPTDVEFTFTVIATNAIGDSDASPASNAVMIDADDPVPANEPPVVTITTEAPTTVQTVSFAIAYTATDAEDTDAPTVIAALNADAPSGYTLDTSTAGMVTIMQAKGTDAAEVMVTITATDSDGATGSDSIEVLFAERAADPPLVRPGAPILRATPGDQAVTLTWTTPTGSIDSWQYSLTTTDARIWLDVPNSTAATTSHTVTTHADLTTRLTNGQIYSFVVRAINAEQMGEESNQISAIPVAAPPVRDTTPPTVTVSATPHPINCDTGSMLSFTFSEALAAGQAIAATELTVSAGWKAVAEGTAIRIVPNGDGTEIGVTTVSVSVNANAVTDVAGNGNTASAAMVFTVGPVLTIPGNSYILVIHPAHANTTHLNDPYVLGSIPIRAPEVLIQHWECMPDLTVFFGRSAPSIGGGAIVIKEADGPLGHDPAGTVADIAAGSVGLSEIMWASDEGIQHGGLLNPNTGRRSRTNYDQTREQWIELHNRNSTPVKVTLFARPTNAALTTETDELDRISNYNINNVWDPRGQSGNSEFGVDFVSMQRGKHDNAGLAPNQAAGYAHGDWNGIHGNRWTASTFSYLTARAGLWQTLAAENQNYDFLGTPGRDNKPTRSTPILRTNVPKNSIVFNEVANRRDQTLEWIELKNVSDAEVNLKKYQISLATAKGTDVVFYNFPDNDNIKLAAGELLLLLDTSPRDNDAHPIAVGQDRDTGNDQALGLGQNQDPKAHLVKYKVANFREGGLPDDGNFVLYLRNGNDKLGQRAKVIDVIGWSDKLADDANHTKIWPLQVIGTPDKRNQIAVETVHRRQHLKDPDQYTHGDKKDEHVALRDIGYTGIGYKRHAQRIAAHGGTPGYEEIRKNENPQLAQGDLTISEIMYSQGDGQYPQWIEIYNSSETEAVNLHAGDHGWRLIIENFDDGEIPVNRLSGTLNFRSSEVQTILPQQTVIVASTRARNSGSAFFDTRVVFPATRVFSVWDDARGELDMKRSTDPILSEQGFYIELIDGKNNFVDGVGNLVDSPNRRIAANKAWELSDVAGNLPDDVERSSILRRYREYVDGKLVGPYTDAEVEMMGVEAAGWIAAHKTDFLDVRQTWFGHPDDSGSPGITGGRVLPVSLSKFRPERLENGTIVIRWITESELNNAGFNILRSEKSDGEFKQINTKLIAGQGTTSERTVYTHTDTSAKPNVVYYYQIQDVSLDGKVQTLRMSRLKGHISPAGKATTTWGELKALQ